MKAPEQRLGVFSNGENSSSSEAWLLPCTHSRPCELEGEWGAGAPFCAVSLLSMVSEEGPPAHFQHPSLELG